MIGFELNKSVLKKLDGLEKAADDYLEDTLYSIANDAVNLTITSVGTNTKNLNVGAVDTGAYIQSFSFGVGSGRPRGKSSRKKRRGVSPNSLRDDAMFNLTADIKRANLKNSTSTRITLRNGSPHANFVEFKHGFYIFAKLKRKYG